MDAEVCECIKCGHGRMVLQQLNFGQEYPCAAGSMVAQWAKRPLDSTGLDSQQGHRNDPHIAGSALTRPHQQHVPRPVRSWAHVHLSNEQRPLWLGWTSSAGGYFFRAPHYRQEGRLSVLAVISPASWLDLLMPRCSHFPHLLPVRRSDALLLGRRQPLVR